MQTSTFTNIVCWWPAPPNSLLFLLVIKGVSHLGESIGRCGIGLSPAFLAKVEICKKCSTQVLLYEGTVFDSSLGALNY